MNKHQHINRRIAVGAGWMISMRIADRLIGLVSIGILARLLLPHDFGLVGYAMVFVGILEIFFQFSFEPVLIRDQESSRESYDTAWTLALIKGVVLALLLLIGAKPISVFFNEPEVETILYSKGPLLLHELAERLGQQSFLDWCQSLLLHLWDWKVIQPSEKLHCGSRWFLQNLR